MASVTDTSAASDEITRIGYNAWKDNIALITSAPSAFLFTFRDGDRSAARDIKVWARLTILHGEANTNGLGKYYENEGEVVVNIFVETSDSAARTARALAVAVRNAYRAHTDGDVTFTRVRMVEAGQDGKFTQYNVIADFDYFERR